MSFSWWFGTWNNPSEKWFEDILSLGIDMTYAIAQLEMSSTGTPHIQFCVFFPGKQSAIRFQKFKCWIRGISAKDAHEKVMKYCTKTDTRLDGPMEFGNKPASGAKRKNPVAEDFELVKKGCLEDVSGETQVKYFCNLLKIQAYYQIPTGTDDIRGLWIYGKPRCGKSYFARQEFPKYYLKAQNKWWDNYRGEPAAILDDHDKLGSCLSHLIKIWADGYPFRGEIKGGTTAISYTTFVVTSNYLPGDIYGTADPDLLDAICRRFYFVSIHIAPLGRVIHRYKTPGEFE